MGDKVGWDWEYLVKGRLVVERRTPSVWIRPIVNASLNVSLSVATHNSCRHVWHLGAAFVIAVNSRKVR